LVGSTKNRRPLILVYYEACLNQSDATRREKYLKTIYGKRYIKNRLKSYLIGQMKFSTRAEYGLKAMTNLAKNFPQRKSLFNIAQEEGISVKYLEQLFSELKAHKLVQSFKGKSGGYTLYEKPDKLTAGDVIETLEGSISPMKCSDSRCALEHGCKSSLVWSKLGAQIRKTLYSIKLSDLI
jgi:Rrf2 family protein